MIVFDNWRITVTREVIARQYDNLSRRIEVIGDLPEGWEWALLVEAGDSMDIIALEPMEGGVGVTLTREQLVLGDTHYQLQIRGTQGDLVQHTNMVTTYIPRSISGDGRWPEIPSEFTQLEQRVLETAQRAEQALAVVESGAQEELARQQAEAARVEAEKVRVAAELARADAEQSRATAEKSRSEAEQSRAEAEGARVTAEQAREERLVKVETQIADILYEPITISSFSHDAGTRELGEVVEAVTLTWATSKAPAALELDGEAIDATLTSKRLEGLNLTAATSWKLKATDERGATAEKTATLSFVNGIYHGAAAEPENVDSAFILGLTKTLTGNKNRTVNIQGGDGLYAWYAYPKRLGTSLFSIGGFDYEYELETVLLTNQHGYQEDYYVYRSGQYAPASLSVTVKNGG